jgi:hypothetical protein
MKEDGTQAEGPGEPKGTSSIGTEERDGVGERGRKKVENQTEKIIPSPFSPPYFVPIHI